MPQPIEPDLTALLRDASEGDQNALDRLMPLVYGELRKIAASYLRQERKDHTLQPTALVHEAYLRLTHQKDVAWQNRAHFFGIAAQMMRRILVDHARKRRPRSATPARGRSATAEVETAPSAPELLALDRALEELEQIDPQQAKIVELRFFGGLTVEETAEVAGISPRTVKTGVADREGVAAPRNRSVSGRARHMTIADARELAADQRDPRRGGSTFRRRSARPASRPLRGRRGDAPRGREPPRPRGTAGRSWTSRRRDARPRRGPGPPSGVGDRVGAYELLSELGQGGMGMVYLARRADDQFQKKVAIKLIRPGMASEFSLQRFRSERQISASLEHPNIARLLDGGATPDGEPVLRPRVRRGGAAHRVFESALFVHSRPSAPLSRGVRRRSCTPTRTSSCTGTSSRETSW